MKAEILVLTMLLLAGVAMAAPGDYPYPVYGVVTEKTSGKPVSGLTVHLITEDGVDRTTQTSTKGYYQFELTTAYSNQDAKVGILGNTQNVILSGYNQQVNLAYSTTALKTAAIAASMTLVAGAGYYYFRKKAAVKK